MVRAVTRHRFDGRSFYTIVQEITSKLNQANTPHPSEEPQQTEYDARRPQSAPPRWIARARAALSRQRIGHCIAFYHSTPSTMPLARQLIDTRGDAAAGAVIIADEQTAGRGRLQRSWDAAVGRGLLGSYILCADLLPERPSLAVMLAGLAALQAIRQCCPQQADRFHLKWPNDVIALEPGGPVKLAGILVETIFHQERLRGVVLGIGVNVNQRADELPPTRSGGLPPSSLMMAGRQSAIDRGDLLLALCRALDHLCAPNSRPPADAIHARWARALYGLGAVVTVQSADGSIRGRAVGTTPHGALLVRTDGGEALEIHAGDVTFDWNSA